MPESRARRGLHAGIATAVLIGTSCGGSDTTTDPEPASAELRSAIATMFETADGSTYKSDEATCVATSMTAEIPTARLTELTITELDASQLFDADFDDAETDLIARALVECKPDVLYELFTVDNTFEAGAARCLADTIPTELVGLAVLGGFRKQQPPPRFSAALFEAFGPCDVEL